MAKKGNILMHRYEVGRMLGQGTFAKVYYARSLANSQSVAIKVIDKEKVLKVGLIDQIKREISVMRLVRYPNVVHLHEVMASKTKIYVVMEYVKGGELFNKIARGRLKEEAARKYFQQLIGAVDFFHSRGVYHRDLKPENLLVDEEGNLKVSDFGLSALVESQRQDGLLHTTCGTPAYVAPEIISKKGYDGAKADIWSCGVILYVLLAGFLPFHDANLMEMYRKIARGDFRCPQWFSSDVKRLLSRILDPNPSTRITIEKLVQHPWFKKGYKPIGSQPQPESLTNLKDVNSVFTMNQNNNDINQSGASMKPSLNAFDIISMSQGFDLSNFFVGDSEQKPESRFVTQKPASTIVSKLEELAETENFKVHKRDGVVKLEGVKKGRKGQLAINAEIFEVTPSFCLVEVKKSAGDSVEYKNFCNRDLKPSLKDIAWSMNATDQQQLLPLQSITEHQV